MFIGQTKQNQQSAYRTSNDELHEALFLYWDIATQILNKSGINVIAPTPEYFSVERNFFSALFMYSYFRAGISKSRRILYAAVNQCLRGMVTGCDNILDNDRPRLMMQFVKVPGLKGKIYVPEKQHESLKKHPCKDCFYCQSCSDDRCRVCLGPKNHKCRESCGK